MGHVFGLGPLSSPNLNITAIWVRDPWPSIQINFWGSVSPTREVPHTCFDGCSSEHYHLDLDHLSNLKMSNNYHLLPQQTFLININYHKIPIRVFLGDIRIPFPDPRPCPLLDPSSHSTPLPLYPCPIFLPKPLPHPLALSHLVALGPPTPLNLIISTIWVRYPWVSIQINFWASLLPTGGVPHTCKIIYYFLSTIYFGSLFLP